jgi:WD40 repeat protein
VVVDISIFRFDGTQLGDEEEKDPGIAFLWNADNDDVPGKLDKDAPAGTYANEDDLHKIELKVRADAGTVRLQQTGIGSRPGVVRVWTQQSKASLVSLPAIWDLNNTTFPMTLWVEGVVGSDKPRDVELRLTHVQTGKSDYIRITVVPLIPITAKVGATLVPLKGAAWKPDGSYCLLPGDAERLDGNTYVAKYVYPDAAPTLLDSGQTKVLWQCCWKPSGAFALFGCTQKIMKYDGNQFSTVYTHPTRLYWDLAWKPGGDYAFLAGESPGHACRCDGTTTTDLQIPDGTPDASSVAWKPNGAFVLCNGDTGCQLKWDESGGPLGTWTGVLGNQILGSLETKWHPAGTCALVGCTMGAVYKLGSNEEYTKIRGTGTTTENWVGICWHPQGNYAILAGSASDILPNGRAVLLYDSTAGKFYEVDCHRDELPFRKLAWRPGGDFAVGAVHNSRW